MKKTFLTAALAVVALGAAASDYPIRPADMTNVAIRAGFWLLRFETNRQTTVWADFRKCEETGRLQNFAAAGRREWGTFRGTPWNDSDVYKIIEGAAYTLSTHPDAKLEKYLDDLIAQIAKSQEPDGYLYTARTLGFTCGVKNGRANFGMMGPTRWSRCSESHELYNVGHLYEAAVAYFRVTGKRTLLDVAIRNADLLDRTFGPAPTQLKAEPGHEEVELALCKLYRATGEERYLRLAKHFLDQRGAEFSGLTSPAYERSGKPLAIDPMKARGNNLQKHMPVVAQREAVGHAVRAGYLYCAMTDVAALTGAPSYLKAVDALWENVVTKKLHLNGSIGARHSGEAFGAAYELPNESAYLETCAGIANALWNQRMFLLHGEAKYVDVLERVLYNGVLSGVSIGGDEFFYPNPLASKGGYRRSKWFGCSCCPVNVVRFIPQVAQFAYATSGNALYANLFAESDATLRLACGDVKIAQRTDYPWKGTVRLVVTPPAAGARFALHVRVPGWCVGRPVPSDLYAQVVPGTLADFAVKVNGRQFAFTPEKGYCVIDRAWNAGDAVEIAMNMPVRRIKAHDAVKDDRGRLAVERGPLVYCAEGADNGGKAFNAVLPADETFADDSIRIGDLRFPALRASGGLKLIPYFAWDHRQPGNEMQTWLRTDVPRNNRLGWGVLASHCHDAEAVNAVLDGVEPSCSDDRAIPRFTVWPHLGTEEWLEFRLQKPETLGGFEVYWFCDLPNGRCDLPAAWKMQSRASAGADWTDVPGDYPVRKDGFSRATFAAPVKAAAFRIVIRSKPALSGGILEARPVFAEAVSASRPSSPSGGGMQVGFRQ